VALVQRAEGDLAVLGVDDHHLAGGELLPQELLGQRVLDHPLDGPAQRAGAEGGVVALLGQQVLGALGQLHGDVLGLELLDHAPHHQVDDALHLLARELVEDDHLVDPVQELGPEVALELVHDLACIRS
jgi:hypothetical protein